MTKLSFELKMGPHLASLLKIPSDYKQHQHHLFSLVARSVFVTPWTATRQASCPSPTPATCSNSYPSSQWCHSAISSSVIPFSSCLQSFPANRVFSNESVFCTRCPKYWSFSISLSNEYSRLISFRTDWLDLLAVQGTLKSLLQHHSSKPSIGSSLKMQNLRLDAHKMMFTYIVIKIIILTVMMSIYYQQSFQKSLLDV